MAQDHSRSFALGGAIIILVGVTTIGRPIFRQGYTQWYKESRSIDGGFFTEGEIPPEMREKEIELARDAQAAQIFGPILVSICTLISGFSPYF